MAVNKMENISGPVPDTAMPILFNFLVHNVKTKIMKQLIIIATITLLSAQVFCQKKESKPDSTAATKVQKQPPQFFIIGQEPDFKLLENVVQDASLNNVTRNEVKAVLEWIRKRQQLVTDTTQKKKN